MPASAGTPQLGQKRMFAGTEVPQFAQERIGVWDKASLIRSFMVHVPSFSLVLSYIS
jgi:hypothetical protein